MAKDFAKAGKSGRKSSGKTGRQRKSSPQVQHGKSGSSWRAYLAGVLTGVFVSFLVYLNSLPGEVDSTAVPQAVASEVVVADPPEPRFDFYTMLEEQTLEMPVEPARVTELPTDTVRDIYLLQAGSFRLRDDADRRRAELLLLGLEPRVEEATSDNGRWFRVYLGPFDSRPAMSKARSLTAAQDIDTLLLKRGAP
ncbi:MAG: SPOR domain-containing protein [Pseudomonadota bacterium]